MTKKQICESCGNEAKLTKHHTHLLNPLKQKVCQKCHKDWNKYRSWGLIKPITEEEKKRFWYSDNDDNKDK